MWVHGACHGFSFAIIKKSYIVRDFNENRINSSWMVEKYVLTL